MHSNVHTLDVDMVCVYVYMCVCVCVCICACIVAESAANNAARTLHRRHSRKKSMHRAQFHELEGREDIEDMIDRASLYDADEEEKMEEAIRSMHTTMAERRSMMYV